MGLWSILFVLIQICVGFPQLKMQEGVAVRDEDEYNDDDAESSVTTTISIDITTPGSTTTPSDAQILNGVDQILKNVQGGHLHGIIDEGLGIRNHPVQNLVRGILRGVFCSQVTNLLNLCQSRQPPAATEAPPPAAVVTATVKNTVSKVIHNPQTLAASSPDNKISKPKISIPGDNSRPAASENIERKQPIRKISAVTEILPAGS